jgi:hypothetical protein
MTSYEVSYIEDGQRVGKGVPAHDEKEAHALAPAMIPAGERSMVHGSLVIRDEHEIREFPIEGTREPDPDGRRQEANAREERIRAGASQVGEWLADVFAAYESRQWEVYELPDWDTYVDTRLPELRTVLAGKDERAAAIGWFGAQGMSSRAIAAAVGTSQSTVARQLSQNDSDTESNRSAGTHDGDTPSEQGIGLDGRRRRARQTATQRQAAREQRENLAAARAQQSPAPAGSPAVIELPEVTSADAHAWNVKELKRLCGQVARGKGDLPSRFYAPAVAVYRNVKGSYKQQRIDVTGPYLVLIVRQVLARGAEVPDDPDATIADLRADLERVTAERDLLRAQLDGPEPVSDPFANSLTGDEAAGGEVPPGAFDDPLAGALTGEEVTSA